MPDDLHRIHHVGIVVRDLEQSVDWYRRHLGFERLTDYGFPGARIAFIGRGDLRLELFEVDGAAPMAPDRETPSTNLKIGGINHFAIAIADLDRTVADLRAAGVEIVAPPGDVPDGRGDRFAFIHDNERMLIELFQPAS